MACPRGVGDGGGGGEGGGGGVGEFWEGRRLTIKLTTLDHFNQFARTPPLPLPTPVYRGGRHPRSTSHDRVTGGPKYPVLI